MDRAQAQEGSYSPLVSAPPSLSRASSCGQFIYQRSVGQPPLAIPSALSPDGAQRSSKRSPPMQLSSAWGPVARAERVISRECSGAIIQPKRAASSLVRTASVRAHGEQRPHSPAARARRRSCSCARAFSLSRSTLESR